MTTTVQCAQTFGNVAVGGGNDLSGQNVYIKVAPVTAAGEGLVSDSRKFMCKDKPNEPATVLLISFMNN